MHVVVQRPVDAAEGNVVMSHCSHLTHAARSMQVVYRTTTRALRKRTIRSARVQDPILHHVERNVAQARMILRTRPCSDRSTLCGREVPSSSAGATEMPDCPDGAIRRTRDPHRSRQQRFSRLRVDDRCRLSGTRIDRDPQSNQRQVSPWAAAQVGCACAGSETRHIQTPARPQQTRCCAAIREPLAFRRRELDRHDAAVRPDHLIPPRRRHHRRCV